MEDFTKIEKIGEGELLLTDIVSDSVFIYGHFCL